MNREQDITLRCVAERQAQIIQEWRNQWLAQAFHDMVSRPEWKQLERNLQAGDIGHVRYDNNKSTPMWRLARIWHVKVDNDGRVRTITVSFRPQHATDKGKDYVSKTPQTLQIGVQMFAVLLAREEQEAPTHVDGQLTTST